MRIDMSNDNAESVYEGGFEAVSPGMYYVMVESYELDPPDYDNCHLMCYRVLSGTVDGQSGKIQREFLSLNEKCEGRFKALAFAAGLIRPGESRDINFGDVAGKVIVVEIEPKKDSKYTRVTWAGFYHPSNPKVAHVPKPEGKVEPPAAPKQDDWGDF